MIIRLNLSVLAIAFACLLLPQVGKAQDGTLENCLAAFDAGLGAVDTDAERTGRDASCSVNQGKAFVRLRGDWTTDNSWKIFANSVLSRNRKTKQCVISLNRTKAGKPAVQTELGRFVLSGKDASAWNKCLKGDCCLDAMALGSP